MLRNRDDSESESLVSKEVPPHGSYTEEGGRDEGQDDLPGDLREMDYVDTDVSVLSQFHEDALSQAGFGLFQWILFFILGLGLAADSIEVFVVAYVLPSAERELCMDDFRKGWLAGISFIGMMIGGLIWGTLADKLGRRRTLLSALTTNAIFAVSTAFMPTYGLFMITRLCSGIGVGGSLPIVFTYYSEFLVKRHRGRHLSWLLIFWAIGGVFAAVMAYAIIPQDVPSLFDFESLHLTSWRVFLLVCAIPAVISAMGLIFLPESPRFLLETGRDVEAMYVYQKVFKTNHRSGAEYQLSELELPSRRSGNSGIGGSAAGLLADILEALETFWNSFVQIFWPPFTKMTFILLIVWTTTAFGFYGMSIWFPEYIRKLEEDEYESNATIVFNQTIGPEVLTEALENMQYENVTFIGIGFKDILLNHCIFSNCFFSSCNFTRVRSSRTFFHSSVFNMTSFDDTDLYDYKFIGCKFFHNTFHHTVDECGLDFDVNYDLSEIYLENLITQLAIIPGNIVSSYVLDRIGRVKTMQYSLLLTSLSAFAIWFLDTRIAVIVFESIFNFISISGWNAVDVITTESYPATLRSTGYGFLSAVSRLAAIMGNVTFARFINVSKAMPILTTAAVLLVGGLFSIRLPETKDILM